MTTRTDIDEVTVCGATPRTASRHLGRYLMFEEIARGEMGALHLGCTVAPEAPRPVTIKQVYPWIAANAGYAGTYLREVRLAARIRHPNVAHTVDVVTGAADGELYVVMDHVHGDTLAHLVSQSWGADRAGPPLPVVAGIMSGLLRGLQAVQDATRADDFPAQHAQREVSAEDVIVGLDGVTRVFEFGAIHLVHGHMRELVSGRHADVFSAGVMMWEMLAGRRLFGGSAELDIFLTSGNNGPAPPSRFNGGRSRRLDAIVLRALRKQPAGRFPSALAFADAIEDAVSPASRGEIGDWVARSSTNVLAARAVRVAALTGPTGEPAPQQPDVQRPRSPRRTTGRALRPFVVGLAVAGALVAAGLSRAGVGTPAVQSATTTTPVAPVARAVATPPPEITVAPPPVPVAAPSEPPVTTIVARIGSSAPRAQRASGQAAAASAARITQLDRAAVQSYERGERASAREHLRAALAECARAGLTRNRIAAQPHALLGVVLAGGFKQPDLAAEQFRIALRIDPAVSIPPRYASQTDVAAAFRAALAR